MHNVRKSCNFEVKKYARSLFDVNILTYFLGFHLGCRVTSENGIHLLSRVRQSNIENKKSNLKKN